MDDRRGFLTKMLALAASGTVIPASAWAGRPREDQLLWRLLRGVPVGECFYGDWRLVEAYPPRAGGVILVVARDGEDPVRVDVVRRGDPVRAPAFTEHLELYVMDGGAGERHIPADQVKALQNLAWALQDNEAEWMLADELLTHEERLAAYPRFMSRAARDLAPAPVSRWER